MQFQEQVNVMRCFAVCTLLLTIPALTHAQSTSGPSAVDEALNGFRQSVIQPKPNDDFGHPLVGALKLNPRADGIDDYFTSQGLLAVADKPEWSDVVSGFLNQYLRRADPQYGWVTRVQSLQNHQIELSDSDDSYIGLVLLLASRFHNTPVGKQWWKGHKAQLKTIAKSVIVENRLPSGLISIFSKQRHFLAPGAYPSLDEEKRKRLDDDTKHAYLMDNCECYAGLKAFTDILQQENLKDSDASQFKITYQGIAAGITSLYNPQKQAFYILDSDKPHYPNFYSPNEIAFYPYRVAQAWPELYGVPMPKAYYEGAWHYLNATDHDWTRTLPPLTSDRSQVSVFPLMSLGYAAALHGDTDKAKQQLNWFEQTLKDTPENYAFRYIQEVGYGYRLEQFLAVHTAIKGPQR